MASFSFWLGIGTLIGLGWVALQAPPAEAQARAWAGAAALAGALIGGRGVYVAVHWAYFGTSGAPPRLIEIPQVWLGGLSGAGALAGGLLAVGLVALATRQSPLPLVDALLPLLAGVGAAAWLGCWNTGVAYGPSINAWYALSAPDEWGRFAPRLPLQPLAALLTVTAVWLAEGLAGWYELHQSGGRLRLVMGDPPRPLFRRPARRNPSQRLLAPRQDRLVRCLAGLRAGLGLLNLGGVWLFVAARRADPVPVWRDFPLDGWFGLGLAVLAALFTAARLLAPTALALRRKRQFA